MRIMGISYLNKDLNPVRDSFIILVSSHQSDNFSKILLCNHLGMIMVVYWEPNKPLYPIPLFIIEIQPNTVIELIVYVMKNLN